ncbi:MAG: MoaD/ThiS family protein [bacterium]|nr:MoaD/ThiS family protein [bacterium]
MRVRVYATLREIVGGTAIDISLEEGARVRDLVQEMTTRWPELGALMLDECSELSRRVHVFIDGRSARHLPDHSDTVLPVSAEIEIFPAIAGGC